MSIADQWEFDPEETEGLSGPAFGKDAYTIFKKSQVMTGFGAAIGKLIDHESIGSFSDVQAIIDKIYCDDVDNMMNQLIKNLDQIRTRSSKIGNNQRVFFHYFIREIFNSTVDSRHELKGALRDSYKKYQSQME